MHIAVHVQDLGYSLIDGANLMAALAMSSMVGRIVMGRVADFYEREWRKKLAMLAKIMEPAMLLIMGAVVGLIVSSLILPIFKLSRAIH